MKQIYTLQGLDCPHCAAEIEREVGALVFVRSAKVDLMQQTLTLESEDGAADVKASVEAIVHTHEPDVAVLLRTEPTHAHEHDDGDQRVMLVRLIVGAVLFLVGIGLSAVPSMSPAFQLVPLIGAYVVLGYDVVWKALTNIARGRVFDEHFLMSLSTIGAFVIGEYPEAVAVMLFYQIGELFQSTAVRRSRRSIAQLMDIRPDTATVLRDGNDVVVPPASVAVGERILVRPGDKVPLDGVVESGTSSLDTAALTGESVPRTVREGDTVLSGCINGSGVLTVRVTKTFGESTASKILDMVENASANKAPTENFITTFARYYTPAVVIAAVCLALVPPLFVGGWSEWIRRAFVFLVVSCPCALVISVPLTFFGGIGAASQHGVLVKGGNYLEALSRLDTVVFDKTGTLTKGEFAVREIRPVNGVREEELLSLAAAAERFSTHPIARSIVARAGENGVQATDHREIAGKGVCAVADGRQVAVGSRALMDSVGAEVITCEAVGAVVYVAVDGVYIGSLLIADEIKADAAEAVEGLRSRGIRSTVMLTGDSAAVAEAVAREVGVDEWHAELLPADKVTALQALDRSKGTLAFVGDGINDAPVLVTSDVGIAMGALGSDAAIEAADVVLMTDEPSQLLDAVDVAKATKRIVMQNIVFALGVKALFLVLGAFGIAGMWEAVFGDVGVTVLAVLNAMRILKK